MKRTSILFLGIVASVLASMLGLVFAPSWQTGSIAPSAIVGEDGDENIYPQPLALADEAPGRAVYRAQGCIYCHSQQIRSPEFGSDIDRGWGNRRSVPRDYLLQDPPMLGTMRTGPDLANIGARQPSDLWHHVHLYDARIVSPGSTMPPFGYLYDVTTRDPGVMGVALPQNKDGPRWIVPSAEARDLVAYIRTLHQDYSLEAVQR